MLYSLQHAGGKGIPMNKRAQHIGEKLISGANSIVNFLVLTTLLLLFAFGSYALWDSGQIYSAADAAQYEIYKPHIEEEGQTFRELQALNPEVFSWLTVYGTNIDYPVAQGEDNLKYVNTNAQGDYSLSGSIFLDSSNQRDFSDFNSILYGHHMEKQTMFGEIGLFSAQDYFDTHAYGNLYYSGRAHGLVFFAFLRADAYDFSVFTPNVCGRDARQAYLDNLLSKAAHTREADVTVDDRIVLLTTCSSGGTNGRDILAAKITSMPYDDTFQEVAATDKTQHPGAGNQLGIRKKIHPWQWILLLALTALCIVLSVAFFRKRRNGEKPCNKNGKAAARLNKQKEDKK
jgi:sortase B